MNIKLGTMAAAVVAVSLTLPAVAALANPDVIKLRDGLMRQNGTAMVIVGKMAQGATDFDPVVAKAALASVRDTAREYPALFPVGSETGDTIAAPAIWEDMEGFTAASHKLADDLDAAIAAVDADGLDGLRANLQTVGGNCQSCHQQYRTR